MPYLHPSSESDRGVDGYLPKRVMDMVRLHSLSDFESLERDSWGIPTVSEVGIEERERNLGGKKGEGLDLVLLPGVAFQRVGGEVRRLGHGGGFYDFFLKRVRARCEEEGREMPVLMGVALKQQILEEVERDGEGDGKEVIPMGEHDQCVQGVFVGDGGLVVAGNRR